jgi:hypothetical protein
VAAVEEHVWRGVGRLGPPMVHEIFDLADTGGAPVRRDQLPTGQVLLEI